MSITRTVKGFSITAYQGDAKTLLAFDLPKSKAANLGGFTILVQPHGKPAYYLLNKLQLPDNAKHAVVAGEPEGSTANAPIQKYRWLHVPGSFHQGENVFYGVYTYTVTPRYFKKHVLQPLDPSLSNSIDIQVSPFVSGQLELAFTRGFVQSQGFVNHFGSKAPFQPKGDAKTLLFDTSRQAGTNNQGQNFTFQQEYDWSGYTARERIFGLLNEVLKDPALTLDVFAYDLDEPDIIKIFLQLAGEGRIRLILDNASLHHSTTKPEPEDEVESLFLRTAKEPAAILRGKFGRFAHDKVMVVYKDQPAPDDQAKTREPLKVLTGSTNFSVTGLYVNANHVLIFNNAIVAALYAKVFQESWDDKVSEKFSKSSFAQAPFPVNEKGLPKMSITFSPHPDAFAASNLQTIADRVHEEKSSLLFAVMDVSSGTGPVLAALKDKQKDQAVFSYGISDSPGDGISLYKPGNKTGVLVTGKPGAVNLPPPFDNEETPGVGHEIHHKFIVSGFNKPNAVLWCGSSNLALGGEEENGDNLIRIDDPAIATVFAIEAVGLVDHFDFRDSLAKKGKTAPAPTPIPIPTPAPTPTPVAAVPPATLHLHDDDSWVKRYYNTKDLYCSDRLLFSNKE